ncbi:MAG TPA: diguanylate cyclase [Gaiellaceae bacterium]|nr:diguanylate cyclase [Gaiellaceae bacterium]
MARLPPRAVRGRLAASLWLLSLAALTVLLAAWVAGEIAADQERENVETRLVTSLRVGREEFADVLADAELRAERLARSEPVQRALAERDRAAARRVAERNPDVELAAGGTSLAGDGGHLVRREVDVMADDGSMLGRVVVGVPLDDALAERLASAAGVVPGDALALSAEGRILAASRVLPGKLPDEPAGSAELGDEAYRYAATTLLAGRDVRLAALAPAQPIEAAERDTRRRALLAALATVALVALLAWTVGRLLRERRRRPEPEPEPERYGRRTSDTAGSRQASRRMRDAVALVGEALAATHDPEALLPVILQSAIEATGAAGASVVSDGREIARAGQPEAGGRPLSLRLGTEEDAMGRLLLHPPANGSFDREAEQLAHWLAAQASIALENERLHRTVKRQAITDELTQLANRRRFSETLAHEVRRAERFGDPLALVLADLDDFKQINDRYGHGTGDEVLRRFADVLRENVRDFDLPVRFGGEEFAVLLPETGIEGGDRLARRLAAALARLRIPEVGGDRAPVTASFGVASFPEAESAEQLLSAADRALYRAKAEGKNRVATAASG